MHEYCKSNGIDSVTFTNRPHGVSKLKKVIDDLSVDLCHLHDSHSHTMAALSSTLLFLKTPMILHRRVDFTNKSLLSKRKYNLRNVKKIISISKKIKGVLLPIIQDPSKITIINSGIDEETIGNKDKTWLRKKFNIADDVYIIGNASALADHKDYPTFLRTARRLLNNGMNAQFFILGDGPERENIEALIKKLKLQGRVHLTGFVPNALDYVAGFDVFLMTSKQEGLGTAVLEAFQLDIPVVSTRGGGLTETVIHHQTGLLAPVGNDDVLSAHVTHVLRNSVTADQIKLGARQLLRQGFTASIMADRVKAVYDDVLAS